MPSPLTTTTIGIVLLCGRSFSGKSTLAGAIAAALGADIVSLDAINAERGLSSGAGLPVQEWATTHDIARSRSLTSPAADRVAIIDDTSSPRFLRDGWRALAGERGVPLVLVYADVPVEESWRRHAANRVHRRRMDITDEVLREHVASFGAPTVDEHPIRWTGERSTIAAALAEVSRGLRHG